MSNFYPFLVEYSLIASNEADDFSMRAEKSKDDVMPSRALPSHEADSNSGFLRLFLSSWFQGDDLMSFLRDEGVLIFNSDLQLFCFELQFITVYHFRILIKNGWVFNFFFCDSVRKFI